MTDKNTMTKKMTPQIEALVKELSTKYDHYQPCGNQVHDATCDSSKDLSEMFSDFRQALLAVREATNMQARKDILKEVNFLLDGEAEIRELPSGEVYYDGVPSGGSRGKKIKQK